MYYIKVSLFSSSFCQTILSIDCDFPALEDFKVINITLQEILYLVSLLKLQELTYAMPGTVCI